MNYIRQLAAQSFIYGLGIVVPRLMTYLLLTPFYTRIFSTEEYGIITEFYAYIVFLMVFLTYGMETGYFRYSDNEHDKNNIYVTSLSSLAISSFLFILLTTLFSYKIAGIIGYGAHPEYIIMIGIIVALDAFTSIPFARLRIENRAFKYSWIRIIEVTSNIVANWFFLYFCPGNYTKLEWINLFYDPGIGIGYVFISNLISVVLKLLLLSGEILFIKGKFEFILLKKLIIYSLPLLIAGLAGTINEALDRILLKYLTPLKDNPMEQLGIYGANFKLAVLMTLFVQMFRYAAEPFFFSKKDESNAKEMFAVVMKYFILSGMAIFLLILFFLDVFVLFIGQDFRGGIGVVPVVLFANLLMGIFFNLSVWYKLTNKTMYGAYLVCGGAIITIIVNFIFIPAYGFYASAWGHVASYSIMVLFSFLLGQKYYRIPYESGRILFYIIMAFCFYGFVSLINIQDLKIRYTVSFFTIIVYVGVFYLLEIKLKNLKYKNENKNS